MRDNGNKKESNVNHKELLTFSNLTNLEWQFVDLNPKEKMEKKHIKNFITFYQTLNHL